MATYVAYAPTTTIARAMFNFDAFGWPNYKIVGTVRVSVSDTFNFGDYIDPGYSNFDSDLVTSSVFSNEITWNVQTLVNIQDVLSIYSSFANIPFQFVGDFDMGLDSTPNPEDVGRANLSDLNITWIYRSDVGFAGISGGYSDGIHGYTGGAGDIFLNASAPKFAGDYSLDVNTRARQTLIHEIGHSLGLSHPHSVYSPVFGPTILADYAATKDLGFNQLGFRTSSAADMHKEYFTVMSYDDQQSLLPGSASVFHAHTPMILDVIALQAAYGEGLGTHGAGNDTIFAGTAGYRTYFDTGGEDTIDLSVYASVGGAYLHMGASIIGAPHLVGVGMSSYDARNTIILAGDPAHLRWFYGEYENAVGSSAGDLIVGNFLDNVIQGQAGDDVIVDSAGGNDVLLGGTGDDQLEGGPGNDTYGFGLGDGQDTVYDFDATPGNQDTLTFDTGILPADIGVYRSASNLVLARRGTYDQDRVTLQQFDLGTNYQIEQVTFTDDATVWNTAYLLSHVEQAGNVIAGNNAARSGQATGVAGMFQVLDPDGGSPYSYEFWDGGLGGGYFRVSGVAQAAGVAIPVMAAQLATAEYVGGASIGSETVYLRAYDGLLWTDWASWTMYSHNRVTNNAPVVDAPDRNIDQNQWRQLSELITVTDADGDLLNQYQISDASAGAGSAYLYANGAVQGQGATVLVSAADLVNTWVNGGANLGVTGLSIRAFDGFGWSAPTTLNLNTRLLNNAPLIAVPNSALQAGQTVAVSALWNYSDADGDAIFSVELYDAGAGGGQFQIGATAQAALTVIPVTAGQLASTQYVAGASAGSETLWARAYDGQAWSAWTSWQQFSQTRPTNNAPVVDAPDRNIDQNQWRQLSELITVTDADGDLLNQYQISDASAGAGSAYLYANGAVQGQGATVLVSAADLVNTWVNGGANLGVTGLSIRAFDGFGWSAPTTLNLNTRATPNRAPVLMGNDQAVATNQVLTAASLWTVTDADADPPFSFELYDAGIGGGQFQVGGVPQAALTVIPVTAGQLASTQYVAGASAGSETLWARAYDGQAWSNWGSWAITAT